MSLPELTADLRLDRPLPRTPLGDAWRAHADANAGATPAAADGDAREAVTVVVLAPALVALAPDRTRLVDALAAMRPSDASDVLVTPTRVVVAPDGRIALVLPLEERAAAARRLEQGKVFATSDLAAAARALGDALQAAHADGGRHGAIFPGLLHLGGGLPPRLLGHGVPDAFVAAGADRDALLATLGARTYAAPELARTGPTPLGDVFSLGATLYACMTGRPPHGGRTTALTMAAVLADEALTGEAPRLPAGGRAELRAHAEAMERLTQALLRAVERAPDDRWPTMGDFVRALDTRVPTPPPTMPGVATRRRHSRLGLLAGVALLAALVAVLVLAR